MSYMNRMWMVILFVQRTLLPTLLPFDGYNSNLVVIMDNCSIHHVPEVIELILYCCVPSPLQS